MSSTREIDKNWSRVNGNLVRTAHGDVIASIGKLYDATNETFCPRSLFFGTFPKELSPSLKNPKSDIECSYKDGLSDRLNFLKVEPELQLYVLLGLTSIQGRGQYLSKEKESERIISYTLRYDYTAAYQELVPYVDKFKEFIDTDVFNDEQYTHVVTATNWGANCAVSLEYYANDSHKQAKAESMLKAELSRLSGILEAKAELSGIYDKEKSAEFKDLRFYIHADIPLRENALINKETGGITLEKATEYILRLPEIIESVIEGKGKPLSYTMVPVSFFKNLFGNDIISRTIENIDNCFIINLVGHLENLQILKQKLNDLKTDLMEFKQYLPLEHFGSILNMQQNIKEKEVEFKKRLGEHLPDVRAGKIMMEDLIEKLEILKRSYLNLNEIEKFIEKFKHVKTKIQKIDFCLRKNIIYLSQNENLDFFINSTYNDLYVIHTSDRLCLENQNLSNKIWNFFFSKSETCKENSSYIVFDFDVIQGTPEEQQDFKIVHYRKGKIISYDIYNDYETESAMNFAKLKNPSDVKYVSEKPDDRTVLKLKCPGFKLGTCSKYPLIWNCCCCKEKLEYGFDDFFYCTCGKAPAKSYKFRCCSFRHGNDELSANDFLKEELGKLRPSNEMNIVFLGETGVGKSTFINAIANYIEYNTLMDAEKGGVISLIPAWFTNMYAVDGEFKSQIVHVGGNDSNEVMKIGYSGTQKPRSYKFFVGDKRIRFIDTPGLGDTGGIDVDKEHMEDVLNHLSYLNEIHGICILLRSNTARLNVMFRFCITELITHLHKNASRNILFCFTHSRVSNYTPGETLNVLGSLLRDLDLHELIPLNQNTVFCFDHEAFRFLCSLKYPTFSYTKTDYKAYEISWTKSVTETRNLFEKIKKLTPHAVTDTTTLCKVRYRILNITKTIQKIAGTINLNLGAIADEEKKINDSLDELQKNLCVPHHIELKLEPLEYPRVICLSSKCVQYIDDIGHTTTGFKQICHEPCFCPRSITKCVIFPDADMKNCTVMLRGKCIKCGCGWEHHGLVLHEEKPVQKQNLYTNAKSDIQDHKLQIEEKMKKYKNEERIIIKTSLKFGAFLKQNAITPYNDGLKNYLEYLIEQEEKKGERKNNNLLENLREMMNTYQEEVKILERSMNKIDGTYSKLTPEEVVDLERQLYGLELTGEQIKENSERYLAFSHAQTYKEHVVPIKNKNFFLDSRKKAGKGIIQKMKKIIFK